MVYEARDMKLTSYRPSRSHDNPTIIFTDVTEFVKALLIKLYDMLHSSKFVRLFHQLYWYTIIYDLPAALKIQHKTFKSFKIYFTSFNRAYFSALFSVLLASYYSQNYAGILVSSLTLRNNIKIGGVLIRFKTRISRPKSVNPIPMICM